MNIDNPSIVLIAIYTQKNDQDMVSFKQLQDLLPLERSHISQALAYNKKRNLIQKPKNNTYFTTILITPQGIKKAQRYITFLQTLLNFSNSPPITNTPTIKNKKKCYPRNPLLPLILNYFWISSHQDFFLP